MSVVFSVVVVVESLVVGTGVGTICRVISNLLG
jgi:hypothetical protein